VSRLEIGQGRAQPAAAETERGRQADWPGRLLVVLTQLRLHRLKPLQQLNRPCTKCLALGRGAHAARGALEQAQAEPRLQRRKAFGDARWGQLQHTGSLRQATVLAHGEHQFQIGTVQLFLLEN
jgi:predicted RNA polymerase sigma factor